MPSEWGLVGIYALTVLARTMVITLIPVVAYAMLETAQRVSELYFVASLFGIAASVALPWLLSRLGRPMVLIGAAASGVGSAVALGTASGFGLAIGLVLHVLMVLTFENVMSLYVLQYVPRRTLSAFEPKRIFLAGASYAIGPWLGVSLAQSTGPWLPLATSAACALLTPLLLMRLKPRGPTPSAQDASIAPSRADLGRFWAQPRLRLAWLLAVARAAWWCMYLVYAPIFAISYGLGPSAGGVLVSLGSTLLLLAPLWGRLARRLGTRNVLMTGYALCGLCTIAVAPLTTFSAYGAAAMLLVAAFAMSAIDGMGNVLFLRAVRPHQRMRMTPIFSTYRDVAQIVPAGLFAVLLLVLPLPVVFIASGVMTVAASGLSLYLSRRF